MHKFLLTAVFLGCVLPGVLGSCEPDCTGKNPGDKVSDPMDCHRYYVCMSGGIPSHDSIDCGTGNHFDAVSETCIGGDVCEPLCSSPTDCHLTCSNAVELIADPFNCRQYKYCVAGVVGSTEQCPNHKPYFDGKVCTPNIDTCCTNICTTSCFEYPNIIQVPDPLDCFSYFICDNADDPDESQHFLCDSGKFFDVSVGLCVTGTTCRNLCGSSSDTTTTTTTHSPGGTCDSSHTCTASGYFPQCTDCQPGYFECSAAGVQGTLKHCPDGKVFNTNPNHPYCISASNCPYYP